MKSFLYSILGLVFLCNISLHGEAPRMAPEREPLALSHGCVNVITGEFVQQEADLIIEGSSHLVNSRI